MVNQFRMGTGSAVGFKMADAEFIEFVLMNHATAAELSALTFGDANATTSRLNSVFRFDQTTLDLVLANAGQTSFLAGTFSVVKGAGLGTQNLTSEPQASTLGDTDAWSIEPVAGQGALDHSTTVVNGEDPGSILKEFLHASRRSGQDADSALSILSHHVQSGDRSTDLRKQTTYLRLLCGDQMERAALDLARLKKDLPNDPFVKFLNGFMGYRLGDYTRAVHSLVPMPAHRWQQGETVVIATILASGGKTREAAKLAERITGQGVFPEERRMLEGWKTRTERDPGLLSSVTLQP